MFWERLVPRGRTNLQRKPARHQILILEWLEDRVTPATVTVTGTGDTVAVDGLVTLREAIISINDSVSTNSDVLPVGSYGTNDTVTFNIPGAGVQTINVTSGLPIITRAVIIDGTTQTANNGDTNPGTLGTGGTVGVGPDGVAGTGDELALPTVAAPEVEIRGTSAVDFGFLISTSNVTIRGLAIYGFGVTNIQLLQNGDNALIEQNVIGSGATAFVDPGPAARSLDSNIRGIGANNAVVRGNLIGFAGGHGVWPQLGTGWRIEGNEIRDNALVVFGFDALEVFASTGTVVQGNLITGSGAAGVDVLTSSNTTIADNTITGAGRQNVETAGIAIRSPSSNNNTVSGNVITANAGPGVLVADTSVNNVISRNSTFGNGGLGIDLSPSGTRGDGVTLNDPGDTDTGPNNLFNFPVFTTAAISGGALILSGFARPGSAIELFLADPDPTGFGEGRTYLVTVVEGSAGDLDAGTGSYGPGPVSGATVGTDTTNRFRFAIPLASLPSVANGTVLTATATATNGSTSEFSGNITVGALISGFVYVDADNDGVFDPGETPLPNVPVTLTGATGTRTTQTRADGLYLFTGLEPGTYSLAQPTQPTGFLDGKDTPGTPFGGTALPPLGDTISNIVIPVSGDLVGINYNFGEFPPAATGDFVWEDRNGNGRQDSGEPGIDAVTVVLTGTDDLGAVSRNTTTSPLGAYLFDNLRPGTYTVTFTPPPGFVFTVRDAGIIDAVDSDPDPTTGQASLVLGAGRILDTIDAGLFRPVSFGDRVWLDLDGDTFEESGEPGIRGLTITATWFGPDNALGTPDDVSATTTTGDDGLYAFTNLPPGMFQVTVSGLPGGLTPTDDADGIPTPNTARFLILSGQSFDAVDFGYQGSGSIGDLVWYDLNADGSSVGEPGIGGVTVRVTWFGLDGVEGSADDSTFTAVTDNDGLYRIDGLPLGEYRVSVDSTSLPRLPAAAGPLAVGPFPTYDLDGIATPDTTRVMLTAGRPVEDGADFGYSYTLGFGDSVFLDLNGDGMQGPGEPGLAGVTLRATWAGPDGQLATLGDNLTFTRTTGPLGGYFFAAVPPGTYLVEVIGGLPTGVLNTGDPDAVKNGQTTFTIANNEFRRDIDFGYQGATSLAGFVYRDFNINGLREPGEIGIDGVTITLTRPGANPITLTTQTRVNGSYAFTGLPSGVYTITETQPPSVSAAGMNGFYDGLDTPGTVGGVPSGSSPAKNQLAVTLGIEESGIEFNFGELQPADPFGFVFVDQNQNGVRDPGEPGITGVAITISGTAFAGTVLARPLVGADLPGGSLTLLTDASGMYRFAPMPQGTYEIRETQPAGYVDGAEENADPNAPPPGIGNDVFSNIVLTSFPIRGPFNFGELLPSPPVPPPTPPVVPVTPVTPPGLVNKSLFLSSTPATAGVFMPTSPQFVNSTARLGVGSPARSTGVAVGSGAGQIGIARLFDFATAAERVRVVPFGAFMGGVRVAAGDVNGDGIDDLITTMGPGGLPLVLVFDGNTGALISGFFALFPGITGGLSIAAGDTNGDGRAEIAVGAATGLPLVAVYDGMSGTLQSAFLAFGGLPVGVNVAVGDVNGDGRADIVTGAAGVLPMVFVYDGVTSGQISAFLAFPLALGTGVNVGVADGSGTGRPQVVAAPASGPAPLVATFGLDGTMTANVLAPNFGDGTRIATADINGDGISDIVVGGGHGGTRVNILSGRSFVLLDDFYGFSPFGDSGVFVG